MTMKTDSFAGLNSADYPHSLANRLAAFKIRRRFERIEQQAIQRFGALPFDLIDRILNLPLHRMDELIEAFPGFQEPTSLEIWLMRVTLGRHLRYIQSKHRETSEIRVSELPCRDLREAWQEVQGLARMMEDLEWMIGLTDELNEWERTGWPVAA